MIYNLPALEFAYNALEPYIDGRTMEVHHKEHHAAYMQKFNAVISDTDLEFKTPSEILRRSQNTTPQ
jgi:Fe-Mn family superoxide dismutase